MSVATDTIGNRLSQVKLSGRFFGGRWEKLGKDTPSPTLGRDSWCTVDGASSERFLHFQFAFGVNCFKAGDGWMKSELEFIN
jgi:hypothetical protein